MSGVQGPLEVVDLRTFEGPESPPSDKGYLLDVRRWYVKAFAKHDLSFQGRFLVESRSSGPVWSRSLPTTRTASGPPTGSGSSSTAPTPRRARIRGCRACWAGVPYDFVTGDAGLQIPGLPDEVLGCMSAT